MSNKLFKQNGNDIVIDDGSKVYNIKNRRGEILAKFCFRPADMNIIHRYEEVKKFLEEFKNEDLTTEQVEELFIEKMDYLVDADTGNTFFSIMGPFSPMPDGSLFCEVCMDTVCNVISKEFDVRLEKVNSRVNKYTAKYRTSGRYTKKKRRHG